MSTVLVCASIVAAGSLISFGGDLDPTLPPAPTMHTLEDIYSATLAASAHEPTWEYKFVSSLDNNTFQLATSGAGFLHGVWLTRAGSIDAEVHLSDGGDSSGQIGSFARASAAGTDYASRFFELNVPFTNGLYTKGAGAVTILYSMSGS
jgi:hypothetical protein